MQRPVQRPRGLEVPPEGLFDDPTRLLGAADAAKRGDDDRKRIGRNGQIVERTRPRSERTSQLVVGRGIAVIAADVIEQGSELRKRRVVQRPVFLQAIADKRAERRSVTGSASDDQHRNGEMAAARHRKQVWIVLFARKVPGPAKQRQCVSLGGGDRGPAGVERPRRPAVQFEHGHTGQTAQDFVGSGVARTVRTPGFPPGKEASMNAAQRLHALGQSLWLDNLSREILDDGTLARYVRDYALTGLTSNPTIFDKAIRKTNRYDRSIEQAAR